MCIRDRVNTDDAQRDKIDREQCQIFPDDYLCGGDGQGIQELICFLLALLRDDAHRQDWDCLLYTSRCV